jgi:glycosyltransferase involved in cell wall biosynthesis
MRRSAELDGVSDNWRPLRIAMVGQKGLPATYGGIEHHVEEIGSRLVNRGHEVTVFNRKSYGELPESPYLGMHVRSAPTVPSKHLDAIVHSLSSTVLALAKTCDVVHYHALGPGLVAPLPRYASRSGVVLTVHGLDQERGKWGRGAQAILGVAHWMSARVPDETVVVSRSLLDHYQHEFGKAVRYVPNGAAEPKPVPPDALAEFGLEPQRYVLFVGRLVPEKAPHVLLDAFRGLDSDFKLVLVGDSSFTDPYAEEVRRLARQDPRVTLTGYVYGDRLDALYQHARLLVQPSVLEGLPLTVLESIGHAVPIVASDIEPHQELLADSGSGHELFPVGDVDALRGTLRRALDAEMPPAIDLLRFRDSVLRQYDWEQTIDSLEQIYLRVAPPGG